MKYNILVINPGSTSDDIGYFSDGKPVFTKTIRYSLSDLKEFEGQPSTMQYDFRKGGVLAALKENGVALKDLSAVVGRGGLIHPLVGGTYTVNDKMVYDLEHGVSGDHSCNLGGLIAREIADMTGIPAFIADPVIVDELAPVARYSGMPEDPRVSIFHALNHKRVARLAAKKLGKKYEECRFIVAHCGGGISVASHLNGMIIDVNNALNGEGPFTPQRSGSVPVWQLVKMCFSGKYTKDDMKLKITGRGGLVAYTGTSDMVALEKYILDGTPDPDITVSREKARECVEAMAYQISKEIGAHSAVLQGKVDAIVITGGLAHDKVITDYLQNRMGWLAPLMFFPGGDEVRALADAAIHALKHPSEIKEYM